MPFLNDIGFVSFFNWEILVKKFVVSSLENSWKHVVNSIGVPEDESAIKMDPVRFSNFVSDNYMFYTKLLSKVLRRFQRLEISSPKNAFMLFRVLKVISQENLFPCIKSAAMAQGHLLQRHDKSKGMPSKCPYEKSVSSKIPTKIFLEFYPEIFYSFLGAS